MRRDKHYAWLLRGHFKGLLEGAASSTPCYTYNSVCLRGNAKQRRQQRRAVERFLAEDQKKDLVDLGGLFPYQRAFVESLDEMGPIDLAQIDTHGGIITVTPVREETDEQWADRVDGGNLYRGPK